VYSRRSRHDPLLVARRLAGQPLTDTSGVLVADVEPAARRVPVVDVGSGLLAEFEVAGVVADGLGHGHGLGALGVLAGERVADDDGPKDEEDQDLGHDSTSRSHAARSVPSRSWS